MEKIGRHHSPDKIARSHIALLLRVIIGKGGIETLQRYGLSFSQIGRLMAHCMANGLIEENKDTLAVTERGKALILKRSQTETTGFIQPEDHSRIQKIAVDEIFLPHPRYTRFKTWRAH